MAAEKCRFDMITTTVENGKKKWSEVVSETKILAGTDKKLTELRTEMMGVVKSKMQTTDLAKT